MTSEPTTSLWRGSSRERFAAPKLSENLTVDLAIIGGGFSGCSAALEAARSGATVCLLEARTIAHGGSGRNVGLVNAGLWLPPDEIVKTLGEPQAARLIDVLGAAPQLVFDLIDRHGIECEPVRKGTLHLAHAATGLEDLRARCAQGNRIGAPIRLLDRDETEARTGSNLFHGSLFDPRAGTIQPLAYCAGLARAADAAGARIFENSPATQLYRANDYWTIESDGHEIKARALLVATNAYHLPVTGIPAPAYTPVNYCQFATVPIPDSLRERILPGGEGCWDTALVMSSIRIDQAGRMIVGGIGDASGPIAPVHHGWARRKLRAIFPELGDLPFEHVWTGRIAMTGDHIPKIVTFGPDACSVFGYSGRGIGPGTTFGAAAARALLSGDTTTLPLSPRPAHTETFTGIRGAYFEFGASATHLFAHRIPSS